MDITLELILKVLLKWNPNHVLRKKDVRRISSGLSHTTRTTILSVHHLLRSGLLALLYSILLLFYLGDGNSKISSVYINNTHGMDDDDFYDRNLALFEVWSNYCSPWMWLYIIRPFQTRVVGPNQSSTSNLPWLVAEKNKQQRTNKKRKSTHYYTINIYMARTSLPPLLLQRGKVALQSASRLLLCTLPLL